MERNWEGVPSGQLPEKVRFMEGQEEGRRGSLGHLWDRAPWAEGGKAGARDSQEAPGTCVGASEVRGSEA